MSIYLINNIPVKKSTPYFSPDSRGYRYGDGFFESCVFFGHRILHLAIHAERIQQSSLLLQIQLPPDWNTEAWEIAVKNACMDALIPFARIRLTVFREGEGYYAPNGSGVCIVTQITPILKEGPYEWNTKGLKVDTYKELSKNSNYISTLKTCSALIYTMASLYAKQKGLDEVIMFNEFGRPCEASSSNIFVVKGEFILTPPISEYCIDGVMRRVLMSLIDAYGYNLQERMITEVDLSASEEIILTSATRGIQWVCDYQGKKLKHIVAQVLFDRLIKSIQ